MTLRSNKLTGSVPSLNNLALITLDVNGNQLTDAYTSGVIPSTLKTCDMTNNTFLCPVTWQSYDVCGARWVSSYDDDG